jgi:hypothetical protein
VDDGTNSRGLLLLIYDPIIELALRSTARREFNRSLSVRPTGGGYSTVEDLLKFAMALQTNKLLKPQYSEMLTTGKS